MPAAVQESEARTVRARFDAPATLGVAAVAAALREAADVRLEPARAYRATDLDTHDWRLWRKGARLRFEEAAGAPPSLVWMPPEGGARRLPCAAAPRSTRDLPPGVLRDELERTAQGRALLAHGRLEGTRRLLRAIDRRGKTVARVWWVEWVALDRRAAPSGGVHRTLEVEPLAGYPDAASRLVEALGALRGVAAAGEDELTVCAVAMGRRPGDYSSKFELTLDPRSSAAEAARAILTALLGGLRANLDGTIADLDTEFLHDLRVAVRRTRSAVGQLRDVFDPARLAPFVAEFRWLGEATGPCRDADVHLEALGPAIAAAPPDLRAGFEAFAAWLATRRRDAFTRLAADLRSPRFARLLAHWSRFLARPWPAARTARGAEPVADLGAERIVRAHRRLARHAAALDPALPPAAMHRLRIDAKKLRYLLEFFASLGEPAECGRLIGELKVLQDELGAFHDAVVQRELVLEAGGSMAREGIAGAGTLLAMGHLAAELEATRRSQGEAFCAHIPRFAAPATGEAFARLVRRPSRR